MHFYKELNFGLDSDFSSNLPQTILQFSLHLASQKEEDGSIEQHTFLSVDSGSSELQNEKLAPRQHV